MEFVANSTRQLDALLQIPRTSLRMPYMLLTETDPESRFRHIIGGIKALIKLPIIRQAFFKVGQRSRHVILHQGRETQHPQTEADFSNIVVGFGNFKRLLTSPENGRV